MSLCCISCKILCFLFLCVYVCGHAVTQFFFPPPFYFICLCGFSFSWLFWTQWHTKTEIVFCWFVQIWAHGTSGQFKEWLVQLRGSGWSKPDLNKGTAAPMENLQEWFETSVEVVEGRWLFAAPNWTLSLCSGSAAELCGWLPGQYKNVFYNTVEIFLFFLYKVWPWSLSNPPIKMWGICYVHEDFTVLKPTDTASGHECYQEHAHCLFYFSRDCALEIPPMAASVHQ